MEFFKSYRFRLYPRREQAVSLRRWAGCSRFIWNELVAENRRRANDGMNRLGYVAMCARLTSLKRANEFLKIPYSQCLQQTLKHLEIAYARAENAQCLPPLLKRRASSQSLRFPQGVQLNGHCVYIPKLGWARFKKTRHIGARIKETIVKFDGLHWYVIFVAAAEGCASAPHVLPEVGIDLGVQNLAALSDGTLYPGFKIPRKSVTRLARLFRSLARREPGSSNYLRAKHRLLVSLRRIRNARHDNLHQISNEIAKKYSVIAIEDLRIRSMTASAGGTIARPGTKVRQKAGLNRSIRNQAWAEFARQLQYKSQWRGGIVIRVAAQYSSQTCSTCGLVNSENRPTRSSFICKGCGYKSNADINAAKNILRRAGRARIACGDSTKGESKKQEAQGLLQPTDKPTLRAGARQKEDAGGSKPRRATISLNIDPNCICQSNQCVRRSCRSPS